MVRSAMAKSVRPSAPTNPRAPPYTPRRSGSSSAMISMARILGAPERVPAGKAERRASRASRPGARSPATVDDRCITWEKRSTRISRSTRTVPGSVTRPRSLRPRSTSITCSARSFSSASSSRSSLRSSAGSGCRGRVPARGRVRTVRPVALTRSSGEAPMMCRPPPRLRWYMYGEGLVARRCRYRSSGAARRGLLSRRESTIWKASPAAMCSRARATRSVNSASVRLAVQPSVSVSAGAAPASGRPANPAGRSASRSLRLRCVIRATASS